MARRAPFELFDELGVTIEDRDQLNGWAARFDQASLILVARIPSDPEQGASSPLGQMELGPHLADRLRRRDAIHLLLQHAQRAIDDAHVVPLGHSSTRSIAYYEFEDFRLVASLDASVGDAMQVIALLKKVIHVRLIHRWLRVKRIAIQSDSISRIDLEATFLSMNKDVSPDFPWKLSECLFVFPKLFFKMGPQLRPVVSLMNRDQLRFFLTGDAQYASIFERKGYTEKDGKNIHVTSHMFRHWLDATPNLPCFRCCRYRDVRSGSRIRMKRQGTLMLMPLPIEAVAVDL